jgi:hypothetical protein
VVPETGVAKISPLDQTRTTLKMFERYHRCASHVGFDVDRCSAQLNCYSYSSGEQTQSTTFFLEHIHILVERNK